MQAPRLGHLQVLRPGGFGKAVARRADRDAATSASSGGLAAAAGPIATKDAPIATAPVDTCPISTGDIARAAASPASAVGRPAGATGRAAPANWNARRGKFDLGSAGSAGLHHIASMPSALAARAGPRRWKTTQGLGNRNGVALRLPACGHGVAPRPAPEPHASAGGQSIVPEGQKRFRLLEQSCRRGGTWLRRWFAERVATLADFCALPQSRPIWRT
mmetsp:Transcript_67919/g.189671  ORF Transcript_67919/g.189671 Transcript_67919/m.189671 type:complete len:218 (+) Transcript_67919:1030-1683(+)